MAMTTGNHHGDDGDDDHANGHGVATRRGGGHSGEGRRGGLAHAGQLLHRDGTDDRAVLIAMELQGYPAHAGHLTTAIKT